MLYSFAPFIATHFLEKTVFRNIPISIFTQLHDCFWCSSSQVNALCAFTLLSIVFYCYNYAEHLHIFYKHSSIFFSSAYLLMNIWLPNPRLTVLNWENLILNFSLCCYAFQKMYEVNWMSWRAKLIACFWKKFFF